MYFSGIGNDYTCPLQICLVWGQIALVNFWIKSLNIRPGDLRRGTWSRSCRHRVNSQKCSFFPSKTILLHIAKNCVPSFGHNLGILTLPWRKLGLKKRKNSPRIRTSPDLPTQPSRARRPQFRHVCRRGPWIRDVLRSCLIENCLDVHACQKHCWAHKHCHASTLGFLPFPVLLWQVLHDNLQELAAHSERRKGGSMDISGLRRFETPQNSTRRPPRETKRAKGGRGKKTKRQFSGSPLPPFRGHHARIFSDFSHSLSTAAFAAGILRHLVGTSTTRSISGDQVFHSCVSDWLFTLMMDHTLLDISCIFSIIWNEV